jgi:hypothetical protein
LRSLGAAPSLVDDLTTKSYVDDLVDTFAPSDFGWKAWAYDPAVPTTGTLGTGGVLYLTRLILRRAATIANLYFYVQTAGVSLTNVGVGLWKASDKSLIQSLVNSGGATTAGWQSGGLKTCAITSSALAAGAYYAGYWATGTTQPSMLRCATGGSTFNAGTVLASGNGLRFAAADTGLTTTAPSSFTQTGNAPAGYWAAIGA